MNDQFLRSQTSPLSSTIELIEKLLKGWIIPPDTVRDKEKNLWYLVQGSANFHIEIFKYNKGPDTGEVDCIEVGGVIMKIPQNNPQSLFRKLLELNSTAVGVYFSVRNDLVMLLSTREADGLDYHELKTMVDEVRYFTDYWDDILINEFGGSK